MATTVNTTTGLNTATLSAATVVAYTLPSWARSVVIATVSGGADVEWSWSGVDGAGSFTSGNGYIPAGGAQGGDIPRGLPGVVYVRPVSSTSTIVSVLASDKGA